MRRVLPLILALFASGEGVAWSYPLDWRVEAFGDRAKRFSADKPRLRRDRSVDVLHTRLEITPDLAAQNFEAVVTHRFRVLAAEFDSLTLDARGLSIRRVSDESGKSLDFESVSDKLIVHFPKNISSGSERSVRIEYSGGASRHLGLHFFKTDPRHPGRPDMVWSQGEAEENSCWIPMVDYPNERSSTEMLATVPEGFTAVSNGRLVSRAPGAKPGTVLFHWLQERTHVGYLITLAVGRFSAVPLKGGVIKEGETAREVPMTVWVAPEREEDARRTFAKTPAMVTYFSDLLASPYPWDKYDQVVVHQFFGGMENTSATNILDRALFDKRAALDNDSDGLISHELAHQWFGDLLTCKDWSHLWLNEGFASYFQAVWKAKDLGAEEFAYDLDAKARRYFSEEGGHARAIVTDRYEDPDDMFDRHTYEKGAWVLHMLRSELGEERFWKVIRAYVAKYKDTVAETEDLRRVIEEQTGKSFLGFFNQWLYGAGSPNLKVKYEWDASEKKLTLKFKQKLGQGAAPFRFPLPVEFHGRGGKRVKVDIDQEEQSESWSISAKPKYIRLDPDQTLLARIETDFPEELLIEQLRNDASVAGRLRAARRLSEKASRNGISALSECLLKDAFWGVASACAEELGSIGGPRALAALKEGAALKHPKSRRAVAAALSRFLRQKEAFDVLVPLSSDPSYLVESAALSSLGALRLTEAENFLKPKLGLESWNEVIRSAALSGLGNLKDERHIPLLTEWASDGKPYQVRGAALNALANSGEGKEAVRDFTAMVLETEEDRAIRGAAVGALTNLGDPRAVAALSRVAARDPEPGMKRRVLDAIEAIREGKKGRVEDLSKAVDRLSEKLEKLEKRLEDAEKKGKK